MEQLSPQDAQFLYMESERNLTHVTSIATFDPGTVPGGKTVRFRDIIDHVQSRLSALPMLKRRLVHVPLELDYPYWVDDEYFDLESHISHGRLPHPGDWRQFCIHMARYHSRPLDMNRPLWEMYVVEGLDNVDGLPKGSYAIATKIHHAAVDGASLMRFFASMADIDNKGTPVLPVEAVEIPQSPRPSLRDMARRAASNNLRSPVRIADALLRSTPGLYRAAQDALGGRRQAKSDVPLTRFNGTVSPHKMFYAADVELDSLKALRPLVPGCTINDVVLAICSGALRKYLQHHRELPGESLVAWVPINARPGGAGDSDAPGNNISAMTTPVHTDVADAVERLRRIHQSTTASKEAKSGLSARLMTDITRHVPAATQVLASRLVLSTGVAARVCNLFVSNVPGPQVQFYMNGARQVGSYGMAPLSDGMGLFIATPSYNGKLSFNVTSTREILPDVEFFMDCIRDALAELEQALADTRKPPAGGKAAVKKPGAAKPKASARRKVKPKNNK
jgi:WS/DGAT/MGAT family acyltransferase